MLQDEQNRGDPAVGIFKEETIYVHAAAPDELENFVVLGDAVAPPAPELMYEIVD